MVGVPSGKSLFLWLFYLSCDLYTILLKGWIHFNWIDIFPFSQPRSRIIVSLQISPNSIILFIRLFGKSDSYLISLKFRYILV